VRYGIYQLEVFKESLKKFMNIIDVLLIKINNSMIFPPPEAAGEARASSTITHGSLEAKNRDN
jgi:hypothetical protein